MALASALIGALESIFIRSLAQKVPILIMNTTLAIFVTVFYAIVFPFSGQASDLWHAPPSIIALTLLSGAVGLTLGFTLNNTSLKLAGVARALPAQRSSFAIFTLTFAILFLDEHVTWMTVAGMVLVLAGLYAISDAGKRASPLVKGGSRKNLGLALAVASGLVGAAITNVIRVALKELPVLSVNSLRFSAGAISLLTVVSLLPGSYHPTRYGRRALITMALVGFIGYGMGSFTFTYAVDQAGAAKTAILSSTAPLFALPLSLLILKEKVTLRLAMGTVMSVVGIALIVL